MRKIINANGICLSQISQELKKKQGKEVLK